MTKTAVAKKEANLNWAPGWIAASWVLGFSLFVLIVIFWSTYREIVTIWWRSETYAHGFLILPIVAYLVWLKRADLASVSPRPSPIAAGFMLVPAMLWLLGSVAQAAVVEQFSVVLMLPILAWAILGSAVVFRILFPLAYLFFAVPAGDFLIAPLQDVTATFTVWALQMTGIPVYLEGRFFYIPSGSFEVAEACSGIRYLIAAMALGTLYAYLNFISLNRRLIFIAVSFLVPILANGIRAYGIVMTAHMSDYTLAVGVDHIIYGWLFFGVVIMLLFWVGSFFREDAPLIASNDSGSVLKSNDMISRVRFFDFKPFVIWSSVVIAIAMSAPGFAAWMDARIAAMPAVEVNVPSANVDGWKGPFEATAQWNPSFIGAQTRQVEYRKNGKTVQVYLAYYAQQHKGAELITWNNVVFDEKKSRRLRGGVTQVRLSNNEAWSVLNTQLQANGQSRMVWHWYEVDGTATISPVWAKIYAVRGRLSGSLSGSAAWVISTKYSMNADEASSVLKDFLSAMLPQMRESVHQ